MESATTRQCQWSGECGLATTSRWMQPVWFSSVLCVLCCIVLCGRAVFLMCVCVCVCVLHVSLNFCSCINLFIGMERERKRGREGGREGERMCACYIYMCWRLKVLKRWPTLLIKLTLLWLNFEPVHVVAPFLILLCTLLLLLLTLCSVLFHMNYHHLLLLDLQILAEEHLEASQDMRDLIMVTRIIKRNSQKCLLCEGHKNNCQYGQHSYQFPHLFI